MALKRNQTTVKRRKQTTEERKIYQRLQDRHSIKIRLSKEEEMLLKIYMEKDGWTCKSSFIREKLFGDNVQDRLVHHVRNGGIKELESMVLEMEDWIDTKETQAFGQLDVLLEDYRKYGADKEMLKRIERLLVIIRTQIPEYRTEFIRILRLCIQAKSRKQRNHENNNNIQ